MAQASGFRGHLHPYALAGCKARRLRPTDRMHAGTAHPEGFRYWVAAVMLEQRKLLLDRRALARYAGGSRDLR